MPTSDGPLHSRIMKGHLSAPRRRLVEVLQEIGFGRIEDLLVRDGEPVLEPPPRVLRDIRLGRCASPHPMRAAADFALRREVVDLFALFDRERHLVVERIEAQNGLPIRAVVAAEARP